MGQTAGPSNLSFWIIEYLYGASIHTNFHLSGTPKSEIQKVSEIHLKSG